MKINNLDTRIIAKAQFLALPLARTAIFVVYFYFGILKLLGESPASPLATALTEKTIGLAHFNLAFTVLAVFECIIGILFLFPKATRVVIPMLLLHVMIVCSPLLLVPDLVWAKPLVPSLEGQYIIKNILLVAIAIGIAAQAKPLSARK